jgi:hypothetical protein
MGPPDFPDLVGREGEVRKVNAALQSCRPAELSGEEGLGKTSLLCYLANHFLPESFPAGVVYLPTGDQHPDDVLQSLFEAFYETTIPMKPSTVQVRRLLQGKKALIVVDDVERSRREVQTLINLVPDCTFLLAAPEGRLSGGACRISLPPLASEAALHLIQQELERPLTGEERPAAQDLCAALKCHPLRLVQAVALVREKGLTLSEVARTVSGPAAATSLHRQLLETLPKPDRRVLMVLAALGGTFVHAAPLEAMTQSGDIQPILEGLMQRGLVQTDGERYRLAAELAQSWPPESDLASVGDQVLRYFTDWAADHRQEPEALFQEADALFKTLERAVRAERWPEVQSLGEALQNALALKGRWAAWGQVLAWCLQSARAASDKAAEAWALHQLGSRALCLEDYSTARSSLKQALRLREFLRDKIGAAVTRHNLSLIPILPGLARLFTKGGLPLLWVVLLVLFFPPIPSIAQHETLASMQLRQRTDPGGGKSWHGTATLDRPALADGVVIALASNHPAVKVPKEVRVEPGATSANFQITTVPGQEDISAVITASYQGMHKTDTLTLPKLKPPTFFVVSLAPATVRGGAPVTVTVTLSNAAPKGGATVTVTSDNEPLANIANPITIDEGKTTAEVQINTAKVDKETRVTFTASYHNESDTKQLTLQAPPPPLPTPSPSTGGNQEKPPDTSQLPPAPVTLTGLTLAPVKVARGKTAEGKVLLSGPAPSGGVTIRVASDNPAAALERAEVRVPEGSSSAPFPIRTDPKLAKTVEVTITATYQGTTQNARLTVETPPDKVQVKSSDKDKGKSSDRDKGKSSDKNRQPTGDR